MSEGATQHRLAAVLSCAVLLAACSSEGEVGGAGSDDCYDCFGCVTDADCDDQRCCFDGDIPSCKDECGSGGTGGSGGLSECEVGCDKLIECLGAPNVSANCARGCETALASADGARTRSCLSCMEENDCSAIFPESGAATACTLECGDGSLGQCVPGEELSAYDGHCHPTCMDVADCYSVAAYCASDSLCYGIDYFTTCPRVANLPSVATSAPLIFDPGQDTIGTGGSFCRKEPEFCANNDNLCQFSFQYYDPDGDVGRNREELLVELRLVDGDGILVSPTEVLAASGMMLAFRACFPEMELSPSAAAVLLDNAGNQSNPLCFTGSAP